MDSQIKFFEVERNDLNDNHMVHSKYNMLNQCYAKKGKKSAQELCDELNVKANKEFVDAGKPEKYLELRHS